MTVQKENRNPFIAILNKLFKKRIEQYKDADFIIQQKTRVFHHIIIAAIIGLILLTFSSAYVQLIGPNKEIDPLIIGSELALILIFLFSLRLLITGFFNFASQLFLISSNFTVWAVTWISPGSVVSQTDTIVIIIALINVFPLFITKNKWTVFIYTSVNFLILMLFSRNQYIINNIDLSAAVDLVIDTSIAMFFSGFAAFQILRINDKALEKVESDYNIRLKAEGALAESELKYKTLIETSQDGISLMDMDGIIIFTNQKKAEMVGAEDAKDLVGTNAFNLLPKDSQEYVHSLMPIIIKKGSLANMELPVKKLDGTYFEAEFNIKILKDSDGNPKYIMDTMRDISDRKKVERELKKSEARYRLFFENAQIGIYQTTPDGRVLKVNPALTKMLGYKSEKELYKINIESDKSYVNSNRKEFLDNIHKKGYISNYESQWYTKDGKILTIKENARAVKNDKDEVLYYEGFVENITTRKKIEKALKESEEKYRSLMENMNDIVMLVDNDDKILFVNNRFTEKLGYTKDEVIGKVGFEFLLETSDREKIIQANKKRTQNIMSQYEAVFIAKDDTKYNFLVSGAPVKNSDGEVIGSIGNMVDITERKKTEQELEKYRKKLEILVKDRTEELATANEELKSTNEELLNQREELEAVLINLQQTQSQLIQSEKMASLGVLAAGVAHEINNPLNFIQGGIFGLQEYFKNNLFDHQKEVAPFMEAIDEGVSRASNIVTSLNHYSRKDESNEVDCNMHEIIDNCLTILHNTIKKRVSIEKELNAKPEIIKGNEGKLHQAILNILTNAVQAIDKEGVIEIKTYTDKNIFNLSIRDTGCGIDNKNLYKIFDPFFTTKDPGEGTGLGLSITLNIINEHNGDIKVNSKLTEGSTFFIELPVK